MPSEDLTLTPPGGIIDFHWACGGLMTTRKSGHKHKEAHRAAPREAGARQDLLLRLRRVEGQVRGVQKMVEDERYCPDVLVQMSAIHESLRAVERILMKDH